jgi:predicted AlkP superfamily pyrophosphatase or phosphodiesterase
MVSRTTTRRLALLVLAGATLVPLQGQEKTARPKLILVLSVDQMRFDYLTRFNSLYQGGLRRLLDQGAVFSKALLRHGITDTGPGHAVILSGRHPSHTGIVSDRWYDAARKKVTFLVEDPEHSALGGQGGSYSPANLLGPTVGDTLKEHSPQSRVIAVSLRERAAVLLAGHRGDAAYWYEPALGEFVTSTYYMKEAPAWLEQWNGRRFPDRYAGHQWTRLLPDETVYEKHAGRDDIVGEWDRRDIRFPHAIRGKPPESRFFDDFRRTPFADEMTVDIAVEAAKAHQLGTDGATDILAVGLAATDVIGHTYGADSQETMDQLLRLDRTLQNLFAEIDRAVGLSSTLVVLTSNHGAVPLVEVLQAKGLDAHRASPADLKAAADQALHARFPDVQDLIAHYEAPNFYLNDAAIEKQQLGREVVESTLAAGLMSTELVEAVYTRAQLLSQSKSGDPYIELYRNSFHAERSPHLLVRLKKYVYLSDRLGGTGHGSPYDYDRHVALIFMGSGIKPGRYPKACGPEDIAPTLARLLGLEYPREPDSRLLLEMVPSAKPLAR